MRSVYHVSSRNNNLIHVDCQNNKIQKIQLPENGKINYLDCKKNRLETINFWESPSIRILNISVNPIDSIDIRGITQLKKLTKDPCVVVKHRADQKIANSKA